MTRPVLVIGLGGTGQWILTYLKKELLEHHDGQVPSEVKFLAFDTEPTRASSKEHSPIKKSDSIFLEKAVSDLQNFGDSKIERWFSAQHNLSQVTSNNKFVVGEGAGQLRQFGRLGVFNNLRFQSQSIILKSIRTRIHELREVVVNDTSLDVFIACSLSGGTGLGMCVDIAHLVKGQGNEISSEKLSILGLFTLCSEGSDGSKSANTYAALRELSHFMHAGLSYPIAYDYPEPQAVFSNNRIFDELFFFEGSELHVQHKSQQYSERGLLPALAHFIFLKINKKSIETGEPDRNVKQLCSAQPTHSLSRNVPISTIKLKKEITDESSIEIQFDIKSFLRIDETPFWNIFKQPYSKPISTNPISPDSSQVFQAEISASRYETKMLSLHAGKPRIIHPKLVVLLEDEDRFKMFFIAKALGFIHLQERDKNRCWTLQQPNKKEIDVLALADGPDGANFEDIFQALQNCVSANELLKSPLSRDKLIQIDWPQLQYTILREQNNLGFSAVKQRCWFELVHAQGIVRHTENRLAQVTDTNDLASVYKDLIAFAKLVYRDQILLKEKKKRDNK